MNRLIITIVGFMVWVTPAAAGFEDPLQILTRKFAPEFLETKSSAPPPTFECGVEVAVMVQEQWQRMSPGLRKRIPRRFWPSEFRDHAVLPEDNINVCDQFLDSAHFRVHYSTQPEHQPPGYPDLQAVRDLADHLETAYIFHRDVSKMGVAVADGEMGGGIDLIDCYFYQLEENWGYAERFNSAPGYCAHSSWGRMAVTTTFGSYDYSEQVRLTSEHEYYHLLQFAHDSRNSWFMESTARNSEFHVWPGIANPRGALAWMRAPYRTVWDGTDFHKYAPHFWMYLEANHGRDIMTRAWKGSCNRWVISALEEEVAARGTDLDAVLTDFAIWNYFTGWRDDGRHYDPAFGLPAVYYQARITRYPTPPTHLNGEVLARPAGSNYILFEGPATRNNLRLTVDGHPALTGQRAVIVLAVTELDHRAWILQPDANGDVDFVVPDWGLYDHVALVVSNFREASSDSTERSFTFAAEEVALGADNATLASLVSAAPNPFGESNRIEFIAPRANDASSIRIYDTAGRLVRTLMDEPVFAGRHQVIWDGRDVQGRRVATGMYLIRLQNGPQGHTRKVMFIR